jgi:F0F1-type ATP synthase assembly protein I
VQQIFAISAEFAVPAVIGYWLDQKWGTEPWLVSVGAVLGFFVGMRHLLQMAARASKKPRPPSSATGTRE